MADEKKKSAPKKEGKAEGAAEKPAKAAAEKSEKAEKAPKKAATASEGAPAAAAETPKPADAAAPVAAAPTAAELLADDLAGKKIIKAKGAKVKRYGKVKLGHLAIFCRQFSTMVDAGVSCSRILRPAITRVPTESE